MFCLDLQVEAARRRLLQALDAPDSDGSRGPHRAALAGLLGCRPDWVWVPVLAFDLGLTFVEVVPAPKERFITGEADLPTWSEQPDGVPAYVLPVRDEHGVVIDLLAFAGGLDPGGEARIGLEALRFGHAALLGAGAVSPWRVPLDAPVMVHRTPMAWLTAWMRLWQSGEGSAPRAHMDHGVCLLGAKPDAERHLGHVAHLACASGADRAWLLALLEANRKARRAREPALPGVWVKQVLPESRQEAA